MCRPLLTTTIMSVIAATAYGTAVGHCQVPPTDDQIKLQSVTFDDFRQLLTRTPPTATIAVPANLIFPETLKDRYPAIVVVHTLGGYLEANEGEMAAQFRKTGFATLTYDSFAARKTTGIALSRSGPGLWPSGVADAYSALGALENHPRIDANHVAIVGFSFGGEVAHLAAFESLRAALNRAKGRFSAHVAFYPAGVFGAIADPGAYSGSPVLMLLGEKDDNLPVAKVESYLAYARSAGNAAPVQTVTYPGAFHAWTVPSLTALRFYPEYVSTKKCPMILLGQNRPVLLIDGRTQPFDAAAFGACMSEAPGYSMLYDAQIRTRSTADAIMFLKRALQP
jgi:dienelactone hydrolase